MMDQKRRLYWTVVLFAVMVAFSGRVHSQVDLTLPHVTGKPGEGDQIAILIGDITDVGVVAYQFEIHYDPDVVDITGVSHQGTLTPSAPTVNLAPSDHIKVAWAGASPLTGEGVLLYLTVEFLGVGQSVLQWEGVGFFAQDNTTQIDVPMNSLDGSVGVYEDPGVPELESPEDGSVNISVDTVLVWRSVSNAYTYTVQVARDSEFTDLVDSAVEIADTMYEVGGLSHLTTYFWRVQSENPVGVSEWSAVWSFTTIVGVPSIPTLISPSDGSLNVPTTVTLTWGGVEGAESYHVQVSEDGVFDELVVDVGDIADTTFEVTGLVYDREYYWRVRAENISGASDWSSVWSFRTEISFPGEVVLISPSDEAVVVSDTVEFRWYVATPQVTHYELELAVDSGFTDIVHTNANISDTVYVFVGELDETEYWWRVRAHNERGAGPFSEARRFSVVITQVDDAFIAIADAYELYQNYPNPFNPSTIIRFSLPERSEVRLELFNAIGQYVTTLVDGELEPGNHEVVWYADQFRIPSGVYLYRIVAVSRVNPENQFTSVRSMILLK